MSRIAFIGLGMMGQPMAHLLHAAGHPLVVKDAHPEAEAQFAASHAGTVVATDNAAYAGCDVVITMLPNSDIVDAVVADLAPHLRAGACVVEMSSADPIRTRSPVRVRRSFMGAYRRPIGKYSYCGAKSG